ncbi:MAG: hypothetical protein QXI19_06320 [Candidatus Caldarchaeum sp.]
MRKQGFALVEIIVGGAITGIILLGIFSLFAQGLRSFRRTDVQMDMAEQSSLAIRKITETLRSAAAYSLSQDGRTLIFQLPRANSQPDPITGEYEYSYPLQGDGISRILYVENETLYYQVGNEDPEVLATGISSTDPDPSSPYHTMPYPVFSATNIGSQRGIRITLITKRSSQTNDLYTRMSNIVHLRNVK